MERILTGSLMAAAFRAACLRMGIAQSMGRLGSALDIAVIEPRHFTLEFELRPLHHFATRAQAGAAVAAWIEDYNHNRRHSTCQMLPRWPMSSSSPGAGRRRPEISLPSICRSVWWQLRRTRHYQDQPYPGLHTSGGFPRGRIGPAGWLAYWARSGRGTRPTARKA
jgi:hypothetical protein